MAYLFQPIPSGYIQGHQPHIKRTTGKLHLSIPPTSPTLLLLKEPVPFCLPPLLLSSRPPLNYIYLFAWVGSMHAVTHMEVKRQHPVVVSVLKCESRGSNSMRQAWKQVRKSAEPSPQTSFEQLSPRGSLPDYYPGVQL